MSAAFDRDQVHAHIAMLHQLATGIEGVLVLACYGEDPQTGRRVGNTVERFAIGDVDEMVGAIMAKEGHAHLNVYAPWHVMRSDLAAGKRGGKDDVRAVLALVVDQDADTGKSGELPMGAPYVLETSTGNFQPIYPLARALLPGEAQPIADALQIATGRTMARKIWATCGACRERSTGPIRRRRIAADR